MWNSDSDDIGSVLKGFSCLVVKLQKICIKYWAIYFQNVWINNRPLQIYQKGLAQVCFEYLLMDKKSV